MLVYVLLKKIVCVTLRNVRKDKIRVIVQYLHSYRLGKIQVKKCKKK